MNSSWKKQKHITKRLLFRSKMVYHFSAFTFPNLFRLKRIKRTQLCCIIIKQNSVAQEYWYSVPTNHTGSRGTPPGLRTAPPRLFVSLPSVPFSQINKVHSLCCTWNSLGSFLKQYASTQALPQAFNGDDMHRQLGSRNLAMGCLGKLQIPCWTCTCPSEHWSRKCWFSFHFPVLLYSTTSFFLVSSTEV